MPIRVRLTLAAFAVALAASPARSADPADEPKVTILSVSPKAANPEPLHPRLLPLESERTPGDAVPIYLRLGAEQQDAALKAINDKSTAFLDGPFADFPVAEARGFVDQWAGKLKQIEFAARRKTAEWNYTLDEQREDAIEILLPDVQEMRTWGWLLAIKARVEIAEKKLDEAARTIETGLSMSRQIAEGPFLINALVGTAMAANFLNRVEEFIAQPGAPNLYWPLTALPRPLVSCRKGMDTEHVMGVFLVPEIADPTAKRTEAEWSSLVMRLHGRWNRLAVMVTQGTEGPKPASPAVDVDFAKFRATALVEAKAVLKDRGITTETMTDDQAIIVAIAAEYRESNDMVFRAYYLPYPEAIPFHAAAAARNKAAKGQVAKLFALIAPAIGHAHLAEARLDRRVAGLRAVEALRMQAAKDGGKLPETLAKVTIVPVPNDPVTGKPFESRRDGDAVTITSPSGPRDPGLFYRVILRD